MSPTFDTHDLPKELCAPALALVGFTGLDALNNAIHRAIWDAFSNARSSDRAQVTFKLLSPDQEFPPMKPRRTSYDWYVPKGILKRNWMDKHLNQLPAVVVIFYDLDWDDQFWNEKKLECASRVQSVRAALEGRGCKVAVTLLQQAPASLPAGEDLVAIERGNALRKACALNEKSLFVLPHGDHLHGYILRLEKAFYELSQSYYHQRVKGVRSHLDQLNRSNHLYLFVRHQFKIGFFSELKQDYPLSHKHYTKAYSHLLEIRILENNSSEIRTVAGYINYKLCRLLFLHLNYYREAITQFRNHIDQFRTRVFGARDLEFEHHAWMCNQFGTFGDLFDEAIQRGLPGIQVQHPGYYYQQAALHAVERKKSCLELCKDGIPYPNPDPLAGWHQLEFFGQRPWRIGKAIGDPSDPLKEKEGILALHIKERSVNHSSLIISILGSAISQFKTYNCPRMRRHLVIQMADEYYSCQDYAKALALLGHVLWEHRSERWWLLLTHALSRALVCAFLTASLQEFVALSIESLGPNVLLSQPRKENIFSNLCKVVKRTRPELDIETEVPAAVRESARVLWESVAMTNSTPLLPIDMVGSGMALAECRARFSSSSFRSDEQAQVEVYVRSLCEQTVSYSRLSVTINGPTQGPVHVLIMEEGLRIEEKNRDTPANLTFESGEVKLFTASFPLDSRDVGKVLQISSTSLQFGLDEDEFIVLRFLAVGAAGETFSPNLCPELQNFRSSPAGCIHYDDVRPLGSLTILPRLPRLSIETSYPWHPPILVGEFFPVKVELVSQREEQHISSLVLQVGISQDPVVSSVAVDNKDPSLTGNASAQMQQTIISSTPTYLHQSRDLQLVLISSNGNVQSGNDKRLLQTEFYISALNPGKREILLKAMYRFAGEDQDEEAETTLSVDVLDPLSVSVQVLSLGRLENVSGTLVGEPFLLVPRVTSRAHCPIRITSSYFNLAENVRAVGLGEGLIKGNQMNGLELGPREGGTEALVVCIGDLSPGSEYDISSATIAAGSFSVCWVRGRERFLASKKANLHSKEEIEKHAWQEDAMLVPTEATVPLPRVRVDWTPLLVEAELPAHGWMRTAMPVLYRIRNCTHGLLRLHLSMEASDAFMFAGHIQTPLCILPHSVDTFTFNLYPLLSGLVALPRLRLSVHGGGVGGRGDDEEGNGGRGASEIDGNGGKVEMGENFAQWRDSNVIRQTQLRDLLDRSLPTHVYIMPQAKGKATSS